MSATEVVAVPAGKYSSQSFDFKLGDRLGFAQGHSSETVTLVITAGPVLRGVSSTFSLYGLTPDEARGIANALYEAAEYADRALPVVTGDAA